MSQDKTHDLHDFMRQLSDEMAAEYDRIQKRATEDPSTAGDQGEENWAELLRGWLPSTYKVVKKGRIISQDGHTSPQVDVLVLKDVYPEKLLNKKLYLAAGVTAAFECKTTLKASHIEEAVETCTKIKNLYPVREGTPYKELHAPIVYGLLAHSHSWKGANATPENNIEQKLRESDKLHVSHPRLGLDLLCVSDLTTWTLFKVVQGIKVAPALSNDARMLLMQAEARKLNLSLTSHFKHFPFSNEQVEHFTPIGSLISNLSKLLAWEDTALRSLADYYLDLKMPGGGDGYMRWWDDSIYSVEVRRQIEMSDLWNKDWDEWNWAFPHYNKE